MKRSVGEKLDWSWPNGWLSVEKALAGFGKPSKCSDWWMKMAQQKRYDQFPQLATMARGMSNEGLALVLAWHRALVTGLASFIDGFGAETRRQGWEQAEAVGGRDALVLWLKVMQEVTGVLSDRRAADWCCKQGMMASPDPCPQHPAPVAGSVRDVGRGAEVYLYATDMTPAGWYAVGRLREEHPGWRRDNV